MKIIGQSTVADGMPFIHLGYTAATHLDQPPALLNTGLALLIVGVAVGFAHSLRRNKSGSTTSSSVRRKNSILVGTGVALAVVSGFGAMVLSFVYGKTVHTYPESFTRYNAFRILEQIDRSTRDGKPVPVDLAAAKARVAGMDDFNLAIKDGWFREMRLIVETRGGKEGIFVVSAGRDGEFGTSDDLRYSLDDYPERRGSLSDTSRPAATQPAQ